MLAVVASLSPLKIQAVQLAYPKATVQGVDAPSGVSDQPVGKDETQQGAQNRLDYARNQIQNAELWVAMENGIWKSEKSPSGWVDGACVIIQKPNQAAEIRWSEELAVPQENMDNCIRDGQVVSNWSSLKDPHATLGKSRVQYLRETLTQ